MPVRGDEKEHAGTERAEPGAVHQAGGEVAPRGSVGLATVALQRAAHGGCVERVLLAEGIESGSVHGARLTCETRGPGAARPGIDRRDRR